MPVFVASQTRSRRNLHGKVVDLSDTLVLVCHISTTLPRIGVYISSPSCPPDSQFVSRHLKYPSLISAMSGTSHKIVSTHNPSISISTSPILGSSFVGIN